MGRAYQDDLLIVAMQVYDIAGEGIIVKRTAGGNVAGGHDLSVPVAEMGCRSIVHEKALQGLKGADRKIAMDETGFHFRLGKGIGRRIFQGLWQLLQKKQKAPG
jgi:hypothetical protein